MVCCSILDNSTRKAGNWTRLCLVQLVPALLVLLIPNTTANHAITYTNIIFLHLLYVYCFVSTKRITCAVTKVVAMQYITDY